MELLVDATSALLLAGTACTLLLIFFGTQLPTAMLNSGRQKLCKGPLSQQREAEGYRWTITPGESSGAQNHVLERGPLLDLPPLECELILRPTVFRLLGATAFSDNAPLEALFHVSGDDRVRTLLRLNQDRLRPVRSLVRRWRHVIRNIEVSGRSVTVECIGHVACTHTADRLIPELVAFANAVYAAASIPPLVAADPELPDGRYWVSGWPEPPRGSYTTRQLAELVRAREISAAALIRSEAESSWRPLAMHAAFTPLFDWSFQVQPAPPDARGINRARSPGFLLKIAWRPWAFLLGMMGLFWGAALVVNGLVVLEVAERSQSWPSTSGTITVSKVKVERCGSTRTGRSDSRGHSSQSTCYEPIIRYDYEVDGRSHTGGRVSLQARLDGSESVARELVARHPKGKSVVVHYDPDQPDTALLEVGGEQTAKGYLAVGAVMSLAGWVLGPIPLLWALLLSLGRRRPAARV